MKKTILVVILLLAHGPLVKQSTAANSVQGTKTVAIVELAQETNSFSRSGTVFCFTTERR